MGGPTVSHCRTPQVQARSAPAAVLHGVGGVGDLDQLARGDVWVQERPLPNELHAAALRKWSFAGLTQHLVNSLPSLGDGVVLSGRFAGEPDTIYGQVPSPRALSQRLQYFDIDASMLHTTSQRVRAVRFFVGPLH